MAVTATDPIKILFAILLPPLGVFLEVGLKGHFWLNILLTLLGFIPGIIHALYVILKALARGLGMAIGGAPMNQLELTRGTGVDTDSSSGEQDRVSVMSAQAKE